MLTFDTVGTNVALSVFQTSTYYLVSAINHNCYTAINLSSIHKVHICLVELVNQEPTLILVVFLFLQRIQQLINSHLVFQYWINPRLHRTKFCLCNAIRLCNIIGINDFAIPSEREWHHTNIFSWK